MQALNAEALGPGFSDPVLDAQKCFRTILTAMSEPGLPQMLETAVAPPAGLASAAAVALLALADFETPVWLPPHLGDAARFLRFHTGAPLVSDGKSAHFAVLDGGAGSLRLGDFDPGDERYPDRSTTVIVQCAGLTGGPAVTLTGPGIPGARAFAPSGLGDSFWSDVAANSALYPRGVDLLLVSGAGIAGLPRSTHIQREGV